MENSIPEFHSSQNNKKSANGKCLKVCLKVIIDTARIQDVFIINYLQLFTLFFAGSYAINKMSLVFTMPVQIFVGLFVIMLKIAFNCMSVIINEKINVKVLHSSIF